MVKLHNTPTEPEEQIERRTQLMHDFGSLVATWSEFEFRVELKIAQLTEMKLLDAAIVLGGLGFGAKANILYSLLSERGEREIVEKVKAVVSAAKRNSLVHGAVGSEEDYSKFGFYKRNVRDNYTVERREFDRDEFHLHLGNFYEACNEADEAMGITDEMLDEYAKAARFYE